jgi:para-nitrobenzyl esterase
VTERGVVQTARGRVAGRPVPGGRLFAGVPYAAPPVALRRFAPPAQATPWAGVRACTEPAPSCPQPVMPGPGWWARANALPGGTDEDCLYLNVLTPSLTGGSRPVMVWLHGGGYRTGSGAGWPFLAGGFLPDDVVLVTVNYRLHLLGFLYLDELFAGAHGTGNLGHLDQVAALEWVRANIAGFGGDPARVTIFGESAGGMSVGALLGMPRARGLFGGAIVQSGGAEAITGTAAAAEAAGRALHRLGVRAGDWDALRSVPADRISELALTARGAGRRAGDWGDLCTVTGDCIFPDPPINAIRDGSARAVAVIAGSMRDEWLGMHRAVPPGTLPPPDFAAGFGAGAVTTREILQWYRGRGNRTELEMAAAFDTDRLFTIPTIRLVDALAGAGSAAWRYRFDWASPVADGALGAFHALDLPFAFDSLDEPAMHGPSPPRRLAADMHGAWAAFAHQGDPGQIRGQKWPARDTTSRFVAIFGDPSQVVADPDAGLRQMWRHQVAGTSP